MKGENTPEKNYAKHIKEIHGIDHATLPDVTYDGLLTTIEVLEAARQSSPISKRQHQTFVIDPFGPLTELEVESELYGKIEDAAGYLGLPLADRVDENKLVKLIQTAKYLKQNQQETSPNDWISASRGWDVHGGTGNPI